MEKRLKHHQWNFEQYAQQEGTVSEITDRHFKIWLDDVFYRTFYGLDNSEQLQILRRAFMEELDSVRNGEPVEIVDDDKGFRDKMCRSCLQNLQPQPPCTHATFKPVNKIAIPTIRKSREELDREYEMWQFDQKQRLMFR